MIFPLKEIFNRKIQALILNYFKFICFRQKKPLDDKDGKYGSYLLHEGLL